MNFPTILYLIPFLAAFSTALMALPPCKKLCLRLGLVDDPGGRKLHESPVALAGGLTVMTALILPTLLALLALMLAEASVNFKTNSPSSSPSSRDFFLTHVSFLDFNAVQLLIHGLKRRGLELLAVFTGAFGMLLLGLLDDKHELRPAAKFAGQLLVTFLVAASGVRITLFVPSLAFSYVITILWLLTVINAFNFVDNMNGLCAGLGVVGAVCFFIISAGAGQYLVALIASLMCGALLGFLPYNFPQAKAFLGDSGSHLVGYLLAILAILPHFYTAKHPCAPAVLSPLLILGVPLGDLLWVVFVRWRAGKPFYVGDTNHLSHRLVRLGLSPVQAVLLIWLLGGVLGALAFIWN